MSNPGSEDVGGFGQMGMAEILALTMIAPMLLVGVLGKVGELGQVVLHKLVQVHVLTSEPLLAIPGSTVGLDGPRLIVAGGIVFAALVMVSRRARKQREAARDEQLRRR